MLSTLLLISAGLILFSLGFGLGMCAAHHAPLMPDNYDTDDLLSLNH